MSSFTHTFVFGDGTTHDASVTETSASIEVCHSNNGWSLFPVSSGLDAAPTWTLEVSNDNVNFAPYESSIVDTAITQPIEDDHRTFNYWRVAYNAQANTTGTVSFPITFF